MMTPAQHQRAKDIFLHICDLSPEERSAYLERACGSDVPLRDAVERMLRCDSDPGGLERGIAVRSYVEGILDGDAAEARERRPERVSGYRILDVLGEGGFGTVYRAEQSAPVQRTVALKVLKPGMDSRQIISRFEAERQALAVMDHPGFARVFDAGQTEAGRPYFAMEMVPGQPITAFCDEQRLDTRARLTLFVEVCGIVQHAHQKGLIHRDIKPSNVLVVRVENRATPKLIDFGIARAIDGGASRATLLTEAGQLIGTPEYMSPEQADGGRDMDTRADIYSLGVLLYELLTGTTPLDRKHASIPEWRRLILEHTPPAPSTRLRTLGERGDGVARSRGTEPPSLVRQVRGDLDWIALRALEPDRERRYESAAALAQDVQRYLRHEPVLARPPTAVYRFSRFARRHRAGLAVGVAIFALMIGGSIGTGAGWVRAMQAGAAEARQRARAETEAATARAIAAFLNDELLTAVRPGERGKEVTVRQVLDEASSRIDTRFPDQPLVEAGVRLTIGSSYLSLGEFGLAEPHMLRAFELRRAELGPIANDTREAQLALAQLYSEQGRLDEAEGLLKDLIERRAAGAAVGPPGANAALHVLATTYHRQGRVEEAVRALREVVADYTGSYGADHERTLTVRSSLVSVLQGADRLDEVRPELMATLESQIRVIGADHPNTLFTRSKLALLLHQLGQHAESEAAFDDVLERMRRVYGPEHPYTLYVTGDLCLVYRAMNRLDEAAAARETILAGLTKANGENHPETLLAHQHLADVYFAQGRLAEAEAAYRSVLAGNQAAFGLTHEYAFASQLRLARTLTRQQRFDDARALILPMVEAARETREERLGEYLVAYAAALSAGGDTRAARELLNEAVELPAATPRARRYQNDARTALAALTE
ncbi:MAG: tetratricopeptide repeat protein [Phycisphaerales bacterium]|nr:tetratricopeptide repeat protein [Phycisphaerales bacterium]